MPAGRKKTNYTERVTCKISKEQLEFLDSITINVGKTYCEYLRRVIDRHRKLELEKKKQKTIQEYEGTGNERLD